MLILCYHLEQSGITSGIRGRSYCWYCVNCIRFCFVHHHYECFLFTVIDCLLTLYYVCLPIPRSVLGFLLHLYYVFYSDTMSTYTYVIWYNERKQNKFHTVWTIRKFCITIVERDKPITPNTQIHDRPHVWF